MWVLRSANTNSPAAVNKLLKEGFEPFAVVNSGKQDSKYKPIYRIYFRRNDIKELEVAPPVVEAKFDVDLLKPIGELLDELPYRISKAVGDEVVEVLERLAPPLISTTGLDLNLDAKAIDNLFNRQPTNVTEDDTDTIEIENRKAMKEKELSPSGHEALREYHGTNEEDIELQEPFALPVRQAETPSAPPPDYDSDSHVREIPQRNLSERREIDDGEVMRPEDFGVKKEEIKDDKNFKMIGEDEDLPSSNNKTTTLHQDQVIELIRKKFQKSNLTIFPVAEDGSVKVSAGNIDGVTNYLIYSDGKFEES